VVRPRRIVVSAVKDLDRREARVDERLDQVVAPELARMRQ